MKGNDKELELARARAKAKLKLRKAKSQNTTDNVGKLNVAQPVAAPVATEQSGVQKQEIGSDVQSAAQPIVSPEESLIPQKEFDNPDFNDAGYFVKSFDPYADKASLRPLFNEKKSAAEMKDMFGSKRLEINSEVDAFNTMTSELEAEKKLLNEGYAQLSNQKNDLSAIEGMLTEDLKEGDGQEYNRLVEDYNQKLANYNQSLEELNIQSKEQSKKNTKAVVTARQLRYKSSKLDNSLKFIDYAQRQEAEYEQEQEKKNSYKELDNERIKNIYKYGAGGLFIEPIKAALGGMANLTEGYIAGGMASFLASLSSTKSDESVEEAYQERLANLKAEGMSDEEATSIAGRLKKILEIENERGKELKSNLLEFANERSESVEERTKAMKLINNYGDIRDGNIFDWASFASVSASEQIPQMLITRATMGGGTYALTAGSIYQQVYNTVVDKYIESGMPEEQARMKALEDEGVNKAAIHSAGVVVAGADMLGQASVFGKGVTNAVRKKIVAEVIKGMTARGVFKNVAKGYATELVTETIQEQVEKEGTSFALGEEFGKGFTEFSVDELKNMAAKVAFGNAGVNVVQIVNRGSNYNKLAANIKGSKVLNDFAIEQIDAEVSNGRMTKGKGELLKGQLQKKVNYVKSFEGLIPEAKTEEALELQEEYDNLQSQMDEGSGALKQFLKDKQNKVKEKLEGLIEVGTEATETETPTKTEQAKPTEQTPTQQVEDLRAEEQVEMREAIPNAEESLTDGKVDREKLTTKEDKAKFDEIYDKYDKQITPLLEKDMFDKDVAKATAEVNDYIDEISTTAEESVFGGKDVVNETLGKINDAEYISDEEINQGLDNVFNEIDRINSLNISDKAKENITNELFLVAEKLDDYEFRTKNVATKTPVKSETKGNATAQGKIPKRKTKARVGNEDAEVQLHSDNSVTITSKKDGGITFKRVGIAFPENFLFTDENGSFTAIELNTDDGRTITITDSEVGISLAMDKLASETQEVTSDAVVEAINYVKDNSTPTKKQVTKPQPTSTSKKSGAESAPKSKPSAKPVSAEKQEVTPQDQKKAKREEAKKVLADLQAKLKKLNNPSGDTNIQKQGVSGDAVIDALFDAVNKLVDLGFDIAEAIDTIIKSSKELLKGLDEKDVRAKLKARYKEKTSSVFQETKGLTQMEYFKQGLAELTAALKEDSKAKRDEARAKAEEKLKQSKKAIREKYAESRDDSKKARRVLRKYVNDLISSKKLGVYSARVLKNVVSEVTEAYKGNIDGIFKRIESVIDAAVHRSRIEKLPKLIKRAKSTISKGKITMYQERLLSILSVNPELIPHTKEGVALMTELENLYHDLIKDTNLSPDNAVKRANDLFDKYSEMADLNEDAVMAYWDMKTSDMDKGKAINALLDADRITPFQAEALSNMKLTKPPKKASGELSDKQKERRAYLIKGINESLVNINPKRIAEIVTKYGEGFKAPIDSLSKALRFLDGRDLAPFLDQISTESLEQVYRALAVSIPANDLSALDKALPEIIALRSADKVEPILGKIKARVSLTDIVGLIKSLVKGNFGISRDRRIRTIPASKIDVSFGRFEEETVIYDNFLSFLANSFSNEESMRAEILSINNDARQEILYRSSNEAVMADMRIFYFESLKLFNSNPNRKGVFHPQETHDANKKALDGKSEDEYYAGWYKAIYNFEKAYAVDGKIDFDKVEKDLTDAELSYIKGREEVSGMTEVLGRVSKSVNRGEEFLPLLDHVSHMNQLGDRASTASKIMENAESVLNGEGAVSALPSTKGGVLEGRVANAAPAVIPSIFKADRRAVDSVLLDYNMSIPVKSARRLLSILKDRYTESGNEKAKANLLKIEGLLSDTIKSHLLNSADKRGDFEGGDAINHLIKAGYYFQLGDPIRGFAEFVSNSAYMAIAEPSASYRGLKHTLNPLLSETNKKKTEDIYHMARVLSIIPSNQAQRILGSAVASIRLEPNMTNSQLNSKILDFLQKYPEKILTTPDAFAAQALFFGKLELAYEKATGKAFNMKTFSEEEYYLNREAIDEASKEAGAALDNAVASNNPYMGIIASTKMPSDGVLSAYDKYLSRFARNERAIIEQSLGIVTHELKKGKNADKSRIQSSAQNLAASVARYFSYTLAKTKATMLVTGGVVSAASYLLGIDLYGDDEDDEEKDKEETLENKGMIETVLYMISTDDEKKQEEAMYKLNREMIGFTLSMAFAGRGNWQKQGYAVFINMLDWFNGEGITRPESSKEEKEKKGWSESDSQEERNNLMYSQARKRHVEGSPLMAKDIAFVSGSLSPLVKSTNDLWSSSSKFYKYSKQYNDKELSISKRAKAKFYRDKQLKELTYNSIPTLFGSLTGEAVASRTITRVFREIKYGGGDNRVEEQKKLIKAIKDELRKEQKGNSAEGSKKSKLKTVKIK